MSLGHDPANVFEFEGFGRCPACRTFWDYLEFHGCSCCPRAFATCWNDECGAVIERGHEVDHSPVEGRLVAARRVADERVHVQRDAIRAGAL